MKTITKKN